MSNNREYGSAVEWARSRSLRRGFDDVEPFDVYNHLTAVNVHDGESVAAVTQQQADLLFDLIRQAPSFKNSKIDAKRDFFRQLVHAAKRAIHACGCVRYTRNYRHTEFAKINVQVIDAAVEAGLFKDYRSPKGSPKESRLLPLEALARVTEKDPWEFDPVKNNQYVLLVDRQSGEEVPFDPAQQIPNRVQRHLERINRVVSQYRIDYLPWCEWMEERGPRTQLRPIHYAKFVDGFSLHGRLYTGRYGHQSLRKIERETIRFDGEPSVEYDYRAMHPRMLYHFYERFPCPGSA